MNQEELDAAWIARDGEDYVKWAKERNALWESHQLELMRKQAAGGKVVVSAWPNTDAAQWSWWKTLAFGAVVTPLFYMFVWPLLLLNEWHERRTGNPIL